MTVRWRIGGDVRRHRGHELPVDIRIIKCEELRLLPFNNLVLVLPVFQLRLHRLVVNEQLLLVRNILHRVLLNLQYRVLSVYLHDTGILFLNLLYLARSHRLWCLLTVIGTSLVIDH